MRKTIPFLVLMTVLFLLPSCNLLSHKVAIKSNQNSNEMNRDEKIALKQLNGRYLKLVEINGKPIDSENNKEPHLIFSQEDNRVYGTGGCNNFSGNFVLTESNNIRFMNIASTKMTCLNMETDAALYSVLEVADNYSLNGDTLTIDRAKMAPQAKFIAVNKEERVALEN